MGIYSLTSADAGLNLIELQFCMKKSTLNLLAGMVLTLLIACYHKADISIPPPVPPPPGPEFKCSHDSIYFVNTVYPIILSGCAKSGCHDQEKHKEGLILDNYQSIMELVIPFDPQGSKLYSVLFSTPGGRMPQGEPFSMEKKSVIYYWIAQGARNNKCDSIVCDTTSVTYTGSVNPIIQTWCIGCHSGSKPANNIALETYNDVVACANSGGLLGSVTHGSGYSPMPKGGPQLSPCEIGTIEKWINTGKPQ